MTPLQIEMMLHFHASTGQFEPWGQAQTEAIQLFIKERLIHTPVDLNRVHLSERGAAYVQLLQMMPLPNATWQIPGPWNPSLILTPTSSPDAINDGEKGVARS